MTFFDKMRQKQPKLEEFYSSKRSIYYAIIKIRDAVLKKGDKK